MNPTALPALRVTGRDERVRVAASAAGCEALLVTAPADVRWLTGFTGSAGHVAVLPDRCVLVTDGRYEEQAGAELAASGAACDVLVGRTAAAQAEHLRAALGSVTTLGLQAEHVTWGRQRELGQGLPSVTLVPTTGLVLTLRQVKDDAEVARIECAAAIADDALAAVVHRLDDGITEATFAAELEHAMRLRGAEGPSFPTIVGERPERGPSPPPALRPHDRPGDLVVVDFGAKVDGYCSDMTRTFAVGDVGAEGDELLTVVTAAQAAGVDAVRAGVLASDVDGACRQSITGAGHGERFVHGTGHGLGWRSTSAVDLRHLHDDHVGGGNVITVEPGVYRAGLGGVRIEDAVLVTPEGCRVLTRFPKDPRCLPSARTTSRPV